MFSYFMFTSCWSFLWSESYEYRYPVSRAIKKLFPHLLNKFEELVQIENPSMEIAEPVKLICKMFLSSSCDEIDLFDSNIFNSWMVLFLNILERPVPLEGQPTDLDHRKNERMVEVKEWTLRILNHLYTCFLNMSSDCAKNFHKTYAGQFMECHLNLLSLIRGDGYLPDRISILILENLASGLSVMTVFIALLVLILVGFNFLALLDLIHLLCSIHKTNMYYLLQPKLDIVLFEIVFPLMCFNDDDQRLWEEDPHEYVRNRYDDDFCSPRKAATNFVIELVRNLLGSIAERYI
ncbi:hypothetical protein Leryth_014126 [Lithospermum erythrorhizon]|nr:hypothetical protein Leryth_014126 [Lithospermum erythrorhizon]